MARILVIDDDAAIRRLILRILKDGGHVATAVESAINIVETFKTLAPEIVIVDMLMPECDGIETIQKLRAINAKVGIIAISGGGIVEPRFYLDLADKFGAHRHLAKPFKPKELIEAVESLCF